jgi:hypothetical protein
VVDDVLDAENPRLPPGGTRSTHSSTSTVLSRRDIEDARVVVTNTPWHPEDLTYYLERSGWPTLTMAITGEITVVNADQCSSATTVRLVRRRPPGRTLPPLRGPGARLGLRLDPTPRSSAGGTGSASDLAAHDSAEYGAPLCAWDFRGKQPERGAAPGGVRSIGHPIPSRCRAAAPVRHRGGDPASGRRKFPAHKIEQRRWEYRNNQAGV